MPRRSNRLLSRQNSQMRTSGALLAAGSSELIGRHYLAVGSLIPRLGLASPHVHDVTVWSGDHGVDASFLSFPPAVRQKHCGTQKATHTSSAFG